MPKEQGGHFGERGARSTSKNSKDKSNSATLRASQSGSHREHSGKADLTNRMLRCGSEKDSEKDSGYSETGSDSVNTDVDDQRSSASEPQRQSISNSASKAAHNMPPYKELAPVYVIKNVMVKPSRPNQLLHSPLSWGGAWHGLSSTKGPTQLLLFQQPTIPAPASSPVAPPQSYLKKGTGRSNQAHKNSYLPILNSYPRIAPHPRKESHESKGGSRAGGGKESGSEGQSQSKRVCTEEEKREAVSTTTHLLKPHQQKDVRVHSYSQHKSWSGHHSAPSQAHSTTQSKSHHSQQGSSLDSISSPSVSSSQTPSPPCSSDSPSSSSPPSSSPSSSAAHSPYRPHPDSTTMRQRRFFNTAEILNQSGLLAITLRTKELLKQNAATEREIAQLRQHTQYLCQAAQANQTTESAQSLKKLVQAMSDSGSYPELDVNQLKALNQQSKGKDDDENNTTLTTNAMPAVISLHNVENGISPPSPLFAPSPEAEGAEHIHADLEDSDQARRSAVTDKELSDLMMLPESSTHNDYLL